MERGREVERQKHTEGRRVKESGRGPEIDRGKGGVVRRQRQGESGR